MTNIVANKIKHITAVSEPHYIVEFDTYHLGEDGNESSGQFIGTVTETQLNGDTSTDTILELALDDVILEIDAWVIESTQPTEFLVASGVRVSNKLLKKSRNKKKKN